MSSENGQSNRSKLFWIIGILVIVAVLAAAMIILPEVVFRTGIPSESASETETGPADSGTEDLESASETETGSEPASETEPEQSTEAETKPEKVLEEKPLSLYLGRTEWFEPDLGIEGVSSIRIYSSSDETVVTVDRTGRVTAVGIGTAEVRARSGALTVVRTVEVTDPVSSMEFVTKTYELEKYTQVDAELKKEFYHDEDEKDIVYSSSNVNVAKVSSSGRITATGRGEADVFARLGDLEAVCHVTVKSTLSSIAFPFKTLSLRLGDTVAIPLVYNPADTTDDLTTKWTSSNTGVLTVDGNGTARAVGAGNAVITAVCGKFKAEATISVVIPVTGVAISATALTLVKGAQGTVSASVVPGNTTEDRTVSFSSDTPSVAKVDAAGVITAIAPGTAHITANHGLIGAVCTVTVLSPLEAIVMNQPEISVIKGFSAALALSYVPADTTDPKTAVWTSDHPEIAEVDANGQVTAVSEGTAVITANVHGIQATAAVTVLPYVEVESVTLSETEKLVTTRGETFTLTAVVTPQDATEGAVTFSSSDTGVATVDGNGTVKVVDRGTAVIKATAGGKSAEMTVIADLPDPDKIVVLDPGHGGRYAGAYYYGRQEEDLNLVTALACKAYLEAHYAGVQVYLTRSTDQELDSVNLARDLEARAQFAQDKNADILVSLHYNASNNHSASGSLVFISAQVSVTERCRNLANSILTQLATTGLQNRGAVVTTSNQYFDEFGNPLDYYAINRHAANRGIPGIIVEHCFMDHDVEFIDSIEDQQRFGVLDAIGIANYLGLPEK